MNIELTKKILRAYKRSELSDDEVILFLTKEAGYGKVPFGGRSSYKVRTDMQTVQSAGTDDKG